MAVGGKRKDTEVSAGEAISSTSVPAAARTLALFEIFAREKRPLSKSELARLLDLPESSCSDLLNTVHSLGYVSRTVSTRRYYPTSRLLVTATAVSENDPLGAVAVEATSLLSQATGETSTFGIIDVDAVKILSVMQGRHRLRYVVQPGDRVTLHATAVGKALLGMLLEDDLARVLRLKPLRQLTPATITDPKKLTRQIAEHRDLKWHGAIDEGTIGVSSFAVAGRIGSDLAAMSVIGPTERILANQCDYIKILQEIGGSVF